jgi:adiponectin receptor
MESFSNKMQNFSSSLVESIDKMEWLELSSRPKPINDVDEFMGYISRWPLFVHMISACICLGFSAFFHLFYVYSDTMSTWTAKLDYAGIIILIFGSTMPPINYYLSCEGTAHWRYFFISIMAVTSLITFCVTLHPLFELKENRKYRGFLFVLLGLCAGSLMVKLCYAHDPTMIMEVKPLPWAIGGIIYMFGAAIYVTRVPERCKPGCFNIFGSSH